MMAIAAEAQRGGMLLTSSTVSEGLSSFITSITGALGDFTTTNLATVLVAALGLTAGLAIAWFAYRFIKGKVSSAMKRGKL